MYLLSGAMLGIGYLNLPYNCTIIGLIPSLVLIFITATISMVGSYLITKANAILWCENLPALIKETLGVK